MFVSLCRQTNSRIYTIFKTVHAMPDMNNIYQFQDIWRILPRLKSGQWDRKTDGNTDERLSDRQTECINTFQLCWKVLKKASKGLEIFIIYFIFFWIILYFSWYYTHELYMCSKRLFVAFLLLIDVMKGIKVANVYYSVLVKNMWSIVFHFFSQFQKHVWQTFMSQKGVHEFSRANEKKKPKTKEND